MSRRVLVLFTALVLLAATQANAQRSASGSGYKNAIGLGIDFGDGSTLVGPSFKHFFSTNSAVQAEVLFGDNYTIIEGFYLYHREIEGAAGLRWYAGIGAGFGLQKNNSSFLIRPTGGIDYKIGAAPLALSFDWRPTIFVGDNSDFEPARFGLGFRFAFN